MQVRRRIGIPEEGTKGFGFCLRCLCCLLCKTGLVVSVASLWLNRAGEGQVRSGPVAGEFLPKLTGLKPVPMCAHLSPTPAPRSNQRVRLTQTSRSAALAVAADLTLG